MTEIFKTSNKFIFSNPTLWISDAHNNDHVGS